MPVFNNILAGAAGSGGAAGYEITRSLRFDSSSSSYLNRTPSSAGNRKTWTWSGWVKRSALGSQKLFIAGVSGTEGGIQFHSGTNNDGIRFYDYQNGAHTIQLDTSQLFRDVAGWYHIVAAVDTTQATASDRAKLYINGEQVTSFATATYPSQNLDTLVNNNNAHYLGWVSPSGNYFNGYLADVHFIDGQALAPTDFGEYDDNNVWQPKEYTHSSAVTSGSFTLADNDFTWNDTRSSAPNAPDSGVLTDGTLNYGDTFYGNPGANGAYLDIDMTGATAGEAYDVRYWNAAEAGGQTITATCKQIDSSGNDIAGTLQAQTWNQGQKWNTYSQIIASNCDKIRLIFSNNNNNSYGWGIGEVQVNFIASGVNDFHLDFSDNSSNAALGNDAAGSNNWTVNNLTAQSVTGPSTGSSWFFDGSSSLYANDSSLALGTGDWTVEYFLLPWNNYSAQSTHIGYNGNSPFFETDGATKVRWMGGSVYGSSLAYPNWYHIAYVSDGGQGAMWVNGTRIATNLTVGNNFTQTELRIGQRINETVGTRGLLSNVHIVVGTAKYKRSQATIPIPHTPIPVIADTKLLALSTNTRTEDASGNNITLTASAGAGISVNNPPTIGENIYSDSMIDTPTNYEADSGNNGGNYATLNPLSSQGGTLSDGNLDYTGSNNNFATIGVATGKWYWEITNTGTLDNVNNTFLAGVASDTQDSGTFTSKVQFYSQASQSAIYRNSGSAVQTLSGTTLANGDVLGIALDLDSGTQAIQFYKNGSTVGSSTSLNDDGKTWTPNVKNAPASIAINFGQRPFAYTPPTGYVSLCTQNLPNPTIADGSTAFDIDLYTGTGSTHERSNFSFNPDLVWIKNRSSTYEHLLFDSVREATKYIKSNSSAQEQSNASTLSSFDSDGFTLGGDNEINKSSETYCAWAWDAGNAANPTSISAGSLNSSVYDQSQTWSNGVSTTRSGNPATQGFDGNDATAAVAPASTPLTITFSGGLTVNSKIEGNGLAPNILINEGLSDETSVTVGAGLQTIYSGSITIQTLKLSYTNNSNAGCFNLLKVDGKVLVDSGVSLSGLTQYPTIASTVRANPTTGFSIVKYTSPNDGADQTVGHGLNAQPGFVLWKNLDTAYGWDTWHQALSGTATLQISWDGGTRTNAISGRPDSSVLKTKTSYTHNGTDEYIAYCWAPVEGYSAFGSYTGNGSADGPFVFTGFRPAFVLIKNSSAAANWMLYDTARNTFNESPYVLSPNTSDGGLTYDAYSGSYPIDILSNGFKVRSTLSNINGNGNTLVYACFAENPFKTARAR